MISPDKTIRVVCFAQPGAACLVDAGRLWVMLGVLGLLLLPGCNDGRFNVCSTGTCVDQGIGPSGDGALDGADGPRTDAKGGADVLFDSPPAPDLFPAGKFTKGHIFVAGSRNAEVFEFDAQLKLISRWTHPSFGQMLPAPGQSLTLGPAGMVFDAHGYLVVAGYKEFCIFSAPNKVHKCHKKVKAQATENIIFDKHSNLYTTTATGGTNEIHKYDATYKYVTTFSMPTSQLTGVTCDPTGDLHIASQTGANGIIYKVDKVTLKVLDKITVPGSLEGLQYAEGATIWVADFGRGYGLRRIKAASPLVVLNTVKTAGMYGPVPVTIDNKGNVYTADYENGSGTAPADLFVFNKGGQLIASNRPSPVYGPFGVVVAGAVLPCGAYRVP